MEDLLLYGKMELKKLHNSENFTHLEGSSDGPYDLLNEGAIHGRIFDENGNSLASDFLVNSSKDGKQYHPTLVKNGNEGFFASWLTNDDNGNYIYSLQKFDPVGNKIGNESQINLEISTYGFPDIALLSNGNLLVSYTTSETISTDTGLRSNWIIKLNEFDDQLNLIENKFSTSTTERNTHSAITKLSDNSLVLVYTKHEYDGINWNYSLYSQKLDFNGNILGNEFQIKSSSFSHNSPFIKDLGDDGYIVIWSNFSSGNSKYFGQRFDTDSNPIGSEIIFNSRISNDGNLIHEIIQGIDVFKVGENEFVVLTSEPFSHSNENMVHNDIVGSIYKDDIASHLIIDTAEGHVYSLETLDYESMSTLSFDITASDGELTSSQSVTVNVNDVFENILSPVISNNNSSIVDENVAIGSVVHNVQATDPEGVSVIYSLGVGGDSNFSI